MRTNIKRNIFVLNILIVLVISVTCLYNYLAVAYSDNKMVYTSVNISTSADNVSIDDTFNIIFSIGANNGTDNNSQYVYFETDNTNLEFPSFVLNKKTIDINGENVEIDGTYKITVNKQELVFYLKKEANNTKIYFKIKNGDTYDGVYFPARFTDNTKVNEKANLTLKDNGETLASTTINATIKTNWEDSKTVDNDSIKVEQDKDNIIVNNKLTYTIKENKKDDKQNIGFEKIKMSDTITFPEGMSINIKDLSDDEINQTLKDILGINGLNNVKIEDYTKNNNLISSIKFTWEDTNENHQYQYTINTNHKNFIYTKNVNNKQIKNELQTTLYYPKSQTKDLSPKTTETTINYKDIKKLDYNNDVKKDVIKVISDKNTYSNNSGYVKKNDYILYRIEINNTGDKTEGINIKDSLPNGLEIVSDEEAKTISGKIGEGYKVENGSAWFMKSPLYETYPAQIENNTVKYTDEIKSHEQGYLYILAKITSDQTQILKNIATINDIPKEKDIQQKETEEKYILKKSSSVNSVSENDEFEYIITLENTGTKKITNKTIEDLIPDNLIINGDIITDNGTINIVGNKVTISDINLDLNKKLTIKIPVKVKSIENNIINTAYIDKGTDKETEASVSISKDDSTTNDCDISKLVKNINDSNYETNIISQKGNKIIYQITIQNNTGKDISYTNTKPLKVSDILPSGLTYISSSENKSSEITGNSNIKYNESTRELIYTIQNGIFPYSEYNPKYINIYITCEINKDYDKEQIINNANIINGKTSNDAIIDIYNKNNGLQVEKTALDKNNDKLGTLVNPGDIVTYKIKITNPEESNTTYNKLTIHDLLVGVYDSLDNSSTKFIISDFNNVSGLTKGDSFLYNLGTQNIGLYSNNQTEFDLIISSSYNDQSWQGTYINPNFALYPGGYIELTYQLKINSNFTNGHNNVKINDTVEDKTDEYKTMPSLSLTKEIDNNKAYINSENKPEDNIFNYKIKLTNTSQKEYTSDLTITDDIPDGLKLYEEYSYYKYANWNSEHQQNRILIVYLLYEGMQNATEFENIKYTIDNNQLKINLKNVNLSPGQSLFVEYKTILTNTEILKYQKDIYQKKYKNIANIHSTEPFVSNNEIVNDLTATNDLTLKSVTIHPGIIKTGIGGFYNNETDKIITADSKVNIGAGASLVWKIDILNSKAEGNNITMKNYKITDYFPKTYLYKENSGQKYPDISKITITRNDGSIEELDYIEPESITKEKAIWNFNKDIYNLNPGDKLTIEYVLVNDGTNAPGTYLNKSVLTVEENIDYESVSAGEYVNNKITDSAVIDVNLYKTNSWKSISDGTNTAYSYDSSPNNYIKSDFGSTIKYGLNIKNVNEAPLSEFTIIDKLPYLNDIGIVSNYERNSQFEVFYNGNARIYIIDSNNIKTDITSFVDISYSTDKDKTFTDGDKDWFGKNDVATWSDTYTNASKLIRFKINYTIPSGATVLVEYDGKLPSYINTTSNTNIAWNNFAYSYKINSSYLIAEPAKVGVYVEVPETNYKITINKKLIDNIKKEKIFYFALFKKENKNIERISDVKNIKFTESGTQSITFNNLPIKEDTLNSYYIYETDEEGNILTNETSRYNIINQGIKVDLGLVNNKIVKEETVDIINKSTESKGSIILYKRSNTNGNLLNDAKFKLVAQIQDNNNEYIDDPTNVVTGSTINGKIEFNDLSYGVYKLYEIKAPEGYDLLKEPILIEINNETLKEGIYEMTIYNKEKTNLPSTGGKTSKKFIIIGLIIMATTNILYIKTRRKK